MHIVYAQQPLQKSIFLAGPSPRPPKAAARPAQSWRPAACAKLQELGFQGLVFVPEPQDLVFEEGDFNRDVQVSWEWKP